MHVFKSLIILKETKVYKVKPSEVEEIKRAKKRHPELFVSNTFFNFKNVEPFKKRIERLKIDETQQNRQHLYLRLNTNLPGI